jgi:hypothetical protein
MTSWYFTKSEHLKPFFLSHKFLRRKRPTRVLREQRPLDGGAKRLRPPRGQNWRLSKLRANRRRLTRQRQQELKKKL